MAQNFLFSTLVILLELVAVLFFSSQYDQCGLKNYDHAGNRVSQQLDSSVTQETSNNLNQLTGTSAGGATRFQGTISQPGTVTVNGTPAQQSTSTNFVANPVLSGGTNTVTVVATNGNNAAQTKSRGSRPDRHYSNHDLNGNLTKTASSRLLIPAALPQTLPMMPSVDVPRSSKRIVPVR